jgi:hypothetical protein
VHRHQDAAGADPANVSIAGENIVVTGAAVIV